MAIDLSILYRGPLASCNYDCGYCPFAKRRDPPDRLGDDRRRLERFVEFVAKREPARTDVLFTPWGEALIRPWYREAMTRLSRMPHVGRVAAQTNLSCPLGWLADCDLQKVGLWCTYHPDQVDADRFLRQCGRLDRLGARYSVGVVALREHFGAIEAMRRMLVPRVYLWLNAFKRGEGYYSERDVRRLVSVDPLFEINNRRHRTLGRDCRTGRDVVAIDGHGDVRRCHFVPQVIANIYQPDWERALGRRPCTRETCGCHIGYVHAPGLDLYGVFGSGVLDRIPDRPVCKADASACLAAFDAAEGDEAAAAVQVSICGR